MFISRCWIELFDSGLLARDTVGVLGIHDDLFISPMDLMKFDINVIWWEKHRDEMFDVETSKCGGIISFGNNVVKIILYVNKRTIHKFQLSLYT